MPRNRAKNQAIGTCLCPFKGCEVDAPLFRYRPTNPDNTAMQRKAGKLYLQCPAHGRTADQEWLLNNATITGEPAEPAGDGITDDTAAIQPPADQDDKPNQDDKPAAGFGFFQ